MSRSWILAFALALPLLSRAEEAAPPRDLSNLVEGLGSEDPAVRERATEALRQLGEEARPALLTAVKSPDAEVRARAEELIGALDRAKAPVQDRDPNKRPQIQGAARVAQARPLNVVGAGQRGEKAVVVERRHPEPSFRATLSDCGEDLKAQLRLEGGVVVRAVEEGSVLAVHDVLLEVDGKPVKDLASLEAFLKETDGKGGRKLVVLRKGERKELVLDRMPE